MDRTALYRHYDSLGRLLYVGIATDALRRLSQHRSSAPWANEIARVDIRHFATRKDAAKAERHAIQKEAPRHNKAHTRLPRPALLANGYAYGGPYGPLVGMAIGDALRWTDRDDDDGFRATVDAYAAESGKLFRVWFIPHTWQRRGGMCVAREA